MSALRDHARPHPPTPALLKLLDLADCAHTRVDDAPCYARRAFVVVGFDYDPLRRWLRERGIRHRIARRGVESSQRLGRHRWVVERTVSWLAGCRRLHRRYERKAEHFLAFVGIAAVLIGYRRLIR